MSPIEVVLGKQMTGVTFRLSPKTRAMLASRISDWSPASDSIFVGFDRPWDFERLHDPMWPQVVMLLTGLNDEQIRDLGGFKFISPGDDHQVVYESVAA